MQRPDPPKKRIKRKKKTDPLWGFVIQTISFSVFICDTKTNWSPKKENKTVSDTGLSLCADRVLNFVQEIRDLKLAL